MDWLTELCALQNANKILENVVSLEDVPEFSDLIPSYSPSTLPALVFANRDTEDPLTHCKRDLIQLASIDGVLRAASRVGPEIKELFFSEQCHNSLQDLLDFCFSWG